MAWFKAIMFKENNNFFCSITDSDPSRYKLPLLSEQSTLWGCPDTTGGFAWNGKGKLSNWPGWSSLESTVHCGSATPDPVTGEAAACYERNSWDETSKCRPEAQRKTLQNRSLEQVWAHLSLKTIWRYSTFGVTVFKIQLLRNVTFLDTKTRLVFY